MTSQRRSFMSRSFAPHGNRWVRWLVLIPEAPLLVLLALWAWLLHFPPLLSMVAVLVVLWFFVRSAVLLLAEHAFVHGDHRRALPLADVGLRMHPWSVDALLLRAHVAMQHGHHAAADAWLQRAVRLDAPHGDAHAAWIANQLAQGRTPPSTTPQIEHGNVSPALLHHYACVALHEEHNAAKALNLLQRATSERLPASTNMPLLLLLAQAYIVQGQFAQASATLQHCEAQLARCGRVQRAEALYHLGCLWQTLGQDGTSYFRGSVEVDTKGQYAHAAWRSAVMGK